MFKAIQRFFGQGRPGFVEKLNEVVDAVNLLRQIRGDETFINVLQSASGGLSIGLNINQVLSRIPKQTFNGDFHVALTKTSGSNGSKTAAASWVYTAKSLDGSVTWGTGLTPQKPRPNGTANVATLGVGYFDNTGTFQLAEAYEAYGTGGC